MTRHTSDATPGASAAGAAPNDFASELRLPRPPGVFRRWLAAHPKLVDGTIVVTYLFGCLMMVALELLSGISSTVYEDLDVQGVDAPYQSAHLTWPWILVSIACVMLIALALAYRRRFPLAGLILVSVLMFFEQGLVLAPNAVALVFMLYAVPVYRSVTAGWVGLVLVVIMDTTIALLAGGSAVSVIGPNGFNVNPEADLRTSITLAVLNAVWLLAVLLTAINLGNRRRYVEALIDRAHQLATEREQRAQLAAAAERSRIAREMHDIVAHSLSVVVTLSEAASVSVATKPEAAASAMERAAETGRSALMEMRRLLGVLSESEDSGSVVPGSAPATGSIPAPRAPQPGMAQLHELVDGFRQAGLRVGVTESGVPAGDATQQLAVYRIVQEALTNTLRYAGRGAEARVVLVHTASESTVEITDAGRVTSTEAEVKPNTIPGSGRGLTGAGERARMFGGTLSAGSHGNGWRVFATVPTGAAAA
ncbi:histidine kinase [Leucobacter sp. UT-8R-CII-1-4]|uniref:sensor histidine kinase n=1 Tax=Leucobacter sp. UT-8R-CII-1-4 TaxID=3040075 RepID=UPI0024A7AEB7|nr:histidine kinase [Leucobacter sp. UT-8R-CII-1-4]MDI6023048.1 histidine kinase [Leucobacter sp. UT-8R-CII-1-4]